MVVDKCPRCGETKLSVFAREVVRYVGFLGQTDEVSCTTVEVAAWKGRNTVERTIVAIECHECGFVLRDDDIKEVPFVLTEDNCQIVVFS